MSEASWLTSTSVNSNSNLNYVADRFENSVQISIGHLEGQVADEEGLRWLRWLTGAAGGILIVDNETATLQDSLVLGLNGGVGLVNASELDVTESANVSFDTINV